MTEVARWLSFVQRRDGDGRKDIAGVERIMAYSPPITSSPLDCSPSTPASSSAQQHAPNLLTQTLELAGSLICSPQDQPSSRIMPLKRPVTSRDKRSTDKSPIVVDSYTLPALLGTIRGITSIDGVARRLSLTLNLQGKQMLNKLPCVRLTIICSHGRVRDRIGSHEKACTLGAS